jgi:hypothetical protein
MEIPFPSRDNKNIVGPKRGRFLSGFWILSCHDKQWRETMLLALKRSVFPVFVPINPERDLLISRESKWLTSLRSPEKRIQFLTLHTF